MAIQCLVGEEQNFVDDPMLHWKPMQFSQHRANMAKLADIILGALFWQHCSRNGIVLLHITGCYSNPGEMLRWH